METRTLGSWEEFQDQVRELEKVSQERRSRGQGFQSDFIFRGQSCAIYGLQSTLERYLERRGHKDLEFRIKEYYQLIKEIKAEIGSLSGRTWGALEDEEINKFCNNKNLRMLESGIPDFGYLAYLRHHGFPSPLLDWSESPYVAAFFAFQNASVKSGEGVSDESGAGVDRGDCTETQKDEKEKYVQIFCYQGACSDSGTVGDARIYSTSEMILPAQIHERHFRQRACYTLAKEGEFFTSFETAEAASFQERSELEAEGEPSGKGEKVIGYRIPKTERQKVLTYLDQYNLNAFTLFGTEDALMETIAFREFSELEKRKSSLQKVAGPQLEAAE
ncbi:MAG: FRG domain-containing protein [Rhodospirillales bacterium]|nr:FRG domain-containing protein [Rhodospirillales bacterium]